MATSQQDVIKKFMQSLDTTNLQGTSAVDAAVRACSNSKYSSITEVINEMVTNCSNSSSGDSFLKNYCGINLDNTDTGAITGYDAGGSTVKTAESIVPESGDFSNYTGNSFYTNGITFNLVKYDSDDNPYYVDYSDLSDVQKIMWRGLYTWWAKNSLSLISESYGSNFGFTSSSSATVNSIYFGFVENDPGTLAWTASGFSDSSYYQTASLAFAINMDYYSNLSSTDVNGYDATSGQTYLDRTLAHEFTHAVMSANINYFVYLPQIIKEGMAELTHGIDDERGNDLLTLANNSSLLSQALDLSYGYHYVSGVNAPDYAGGFMLLRYLAKQVSDSDDSGGGGGGTDTVTFTNGADYYNGSISNTVLSALGGNDTLYSLGSKVRVNAGSGNDSVYIAGTNNTVYGGTGSDYFYLYGDSYNTKAYGESGSDSIHSGSKAATISGGAGNDYVLLYNDATNTKVTGGTGKDTLRSGAKTATIDGGSGNDYLYTYTNAVSTKIIGGAGNDTIEDGGTKSYISAGTGNDYIYLFTDASNTTVFGGAGKDSIYSGASTSSLSGGSGNDYIHIYSDASNTTVNGGTGNDTIRSYSTSGVTYVYKNGDGKDVIYGFNSSNDRIKLTSGSIKSYSYSGSDVIFKVGSGTIRVKDGKGKSIKVTGSNGTTRTYSFAANSPVENYFASDVDLSAADSHGRAAEEIAASTDVFPSTTNNVADTWFTEDDNNFGTNGADIGEITTVNIQPPAEVTWNSNTTQLNNNNQYKSVLVYPTKK